MRAPRKPRPPSTRNVISSARRLTGDEPYEIASAIRSGKVVPSNDVDALAQWVLELDADPIDALAIERRDHAATQQRFAAQQLAAPTEKLTSAFNRVTLSVAGRSFDELTEQWDEEDRQQAASLSAAEAELKAAKSAAKNGGAH